MIWMFHWSFYFLFFGIIEGPAQVPWPAGAVQQNIDD